MTCPNCGYTGNPDGAVYCNACNGLISQNGSLANVPNVTYDNQNYANQNNAAFDNSGAAFNNNAAYNQYAPAYQPVAAQPARNNQKTILTALIAVVAVVLVGFLLVASGIVKVNACDDKKESSTSGGKIDAGDVIAGALATAEEYKKVDLCFVVDTTSSMDDDVAQLNKDLAKYIAVLKEKCTKDYRIALIDYRDNPMMTFDFDDYPYKVRLDFTNKTKKIYDAFAKLDMGYGGDWEETAFSAIIEGGDKLSWRSDAAKIMVVITDAPAQDPEYVSGYDSSDAKSFLKDEGIMLFVIDSANDREVKACFSPLCKATGGIYQGINKVGEMTDAMAEILDTASAHMK